MKRLTAYITGRVQKAGYRAKVVEIAKALRLTGSVQNLEDGRVRIIAEGDDLILEAFLKAVNIKNTIIHVDEIYSSYSEATGDYKGFYKLVEGNETDSRLDQGVMVLKEILGAIKDMNISIKDLGSKQDKMLEKQDRSLDMQAQTLDEIKGLRITQDKMLEKQDRSLDMQAKMLEKQDRSLDMQAKMLEKQDRSLDMQAQTLEELKGLRVDVQSGDVQHVQMQSDIKSIKARLGMP